MFLFVVYSFILYVFYENSFCFEHFGNIKIPVKNQKTVYINKIYWFTNKHIYLQKLFKTDYVFN